MLVQRKINGVDLGVSNNKPNEFFFEPAFLQSHPNLTKQITPVDLCGVLAGDKYVPLLMTWELTDKCSFACPFCYIVGHSNKRLVRFQEMRPHIKELIDMGLLYCNLTGGEATLHPDFIEIYLFLKKNGVIVEVFTNGSLLTQRHIDVFKKYPPFKIEVTIYGVSQTRFINATGSIKFDYNSILKNILQLKDIGLNVICKTPLNKTTENEFEDIKHWCKTNDVFFYYSTDVYEAYDGKTLENFSVDRSKKTRYDAEKVVDIYNTFPKLLDTIQPHGKACYTCGIKKYGLHINGGFELMPCSETHFTETKSAIITTGIHFAIEKYRDFIEKFIDRSIIGCSGCEASATCKMCSAKADVVRNEDNEITDFKVPENHCENERKKIRSINEYIMSTI